MKKSLNCSRQWQRCASREMPSPSTVSVFAVLLLITVYPCCQDALASPLLNRVRYLCPGNHSLTEEQRLDDLHPWWLAQLQLVFKLSSNGKRDGQKITIAEPISMERLAPLTIQCSVWPGVIAAVVYIPVEDGKIISKDSSVFHRMSMSKALDMIKEEHSRLSEMCVLDITVYMEDLSGGRRYDPYYSYPVNALRNKALEMVQTEMVLLLDGDFIPAPMEFIGRLHRDARFYEELLELMHRKFVVVLPAMELSPHIQNATMKGETKLLADVLHAKKQMITKFVADNKLVEFQPWGHADTLWEQKWLEAEEMYEITYNTSQVLVADDEEEGPSYYVRNYPNFLSTSQLEKRNETCIEGPGKYEPYILALREDLPWWDERFRGYFRNKASYTFLLYKENRKFIVHPSGFVLHYPHLQISDLRIQLQSRYFHKIKDLYYMRIPHEYLEHTYAPVRAATAECNTSTTNTAVSR